MLSEITVVEKSHFKVLYVLVDADVQFMQLFYIFNSDVIFSVQPLRLNVC